MCCHFAVLWCVDLCASFGCMWFCVVYVRCVVCVAASRLIELAEDCAWSVGRISASSPCSRSLFSRLWENIFHTCHISLTRCDLTPHSAGNSN